MACPDTTTKEWKLLSKYMDGEVEAMRIFKAKGDIMPVVPTLTEIKKELSFKAKGVSDLQKNLILKKLGIYNEKHNTTHRVDSKVVSPTSYDLQLVLNFMPKFDIEYSNDVLETVKTSGNVSFETVKSPEDIISSEGNQYIVHGEVYPSYDDAINALYARRKATNKKAVAEVDSVMKAMLAKQGIKVEYINNFAEKYKMDALAVADMANKIVAVADGRQDALTLPEEAAHFIVEMMDNNSSLYKQMYNEVVNAPEYQEVLNDYSVLYGDNEAKLRKEAMGKVLSRYLFKDALEASPKMNTILNRILNWIKRTFGRMDNSLLETKIDQIYGRVSKSAIKGSLDLDSERIDINEGVYARAGDLELTMTNVLKRMVARVNKLQREASSTDDKALVASMVQSINDIKIRIEQAEETLGVAAFVNSLYQNELKFILNEINAKYTDSDGSIIPDKADWSSSEVRGMHDTVKLNESLIASIQEVLEFDPYYKEIAAKTKPLVDEAVKDLAKIKRFVTKVQKNKTIQVGKNIGLSNEEIKQVVGSTEGDINAIAKWFGPLSSVKDAALNRIYKFVANIINGVHRRTLAVGKELYDAQINFEKAGFKMSDMHEVDEKGKKTGYLSAELKYGEYFKQEALTKERIAKLLGKEDYSEVSYSSMEDDAKNGDDTGLKQYKEEWAKFNKKYRIKTSDGRWVIAGPKNTQHRKNMQNKAYADYWKLLMRINTQVKNKLPAKYSSPRYLYMMPQIRKDVMQTLKYKEGSVLNQIGSKFKEIYKITEDDTEFGDRDVMLDIDGQVAKLVPIHYRTKLSNMNALSNDITSMYTAYYEMADNFRSMSENLDDIMLIKDAIGDRSVIKGKDRIKGAETNAYAALDSFIDSTVYGIKSKDVVVNMPNGKKINITKGINSAIGYIRANNLFLNMPSTISGYVKGSIDSKLEDIHGIFSTLESKLWAEGELDRNIFSVASEFKRRKKTNKVSLMFEEFGVAGEIREIFSRMDIDTSIGRMGISDYLYSTYEFADFRVKGKLALSIMDNYRLVDGKFMRKDRFKKKFPKKNWKDYADKTFYKAHETKNGKLVVKNEFKKYVNDDIRNIITNTIRSRTNTVAGTLSSLDKGMAFRTALGRFIMIHRGWIVSGIVDRFKPTQYNAAIDAHEEGSYRSVINYLAKALTEFQFDGKAHVAYWKDLEGYQKANFIKVGADVAFTIVVLTVAKLFNAAAEGDDDEWFNQYLAYQANRVLLEQAAFWNPMEIPNVMNSPSAGMSHIEDIFSMGQMLFDWDELESGPYKGYNKMQKFLIKRSLLKNLYDIQFPEQKNKFLKGQIL